MSVVEAIVSSAVAKLSTHPRVIIGISGSQGSGKTTVTVEAARLLRDKYNIPTLAVSLDDYYLPHNQLKEIAKRGNPLLKQRGLPGTHDAALLTRFCEDFLHAADTSELSVCTYDKSLFDGAGDRSGFVKLPAKCQVVLLEGWMVGFQPLGQENLLGKASAVANATVKPSDKDLIEIDENLKEYVPIWDCISLWVRLVPRNLDFVYVWRKQQEHAMIAAKGSGMSDDEVSAFVDQYIPCYLLYNATLDRLPRDTIVFELDINHKATMI